MGENMCGIKAGWEAAHMKTLRAGPSSIGTFPKVVVKADVIAAVILWHTANEGPRHNEASPALLPLPYQPHSARTLISLLIIARRFDGWACEVSWVA